MAGDKLAGYGLPLPPPQSQVGAGWTPKSPGIIAASKGTQIQPLPQAPQKIKVVQRPQPKAAVADTATPMQTITTAAKWRKTVVMKYRKKTDHYRLRVVEVEPYSVRGPYLYAFCLQHNAIHSFLISNIVSVQSTDRKYTPRWQVELT